MTMTAVQTPLAAGESMKTMAAWQGAADGRAPAATLDATRSTELLTKAIDYAILAPSSHNTQPWRFKVRYGGLELHLDRNRVRPVADPACREHVISCGAALQNIRLALRHWGYAAKVEVLPYASNPDVLARVELGAPRHTRSLYHEMLFAAIPKRHTSRASFGRRPLGRWLVTALQRGAESQGASLRPVTDAPIRSAVADLVAEGDRLQWANGAFRRELAAWRRPNGGASRDGIPGYAFGMSDLASRLAPAVLPWVPAGRAQARRSRALALEAPLLAVLATADDTPADWLAVGQALQRTLLIAAAIGVRASFLNQPVQVPALRTRLRALLGEPGFPQVVLRMGYGPAVTPTPRRSVSEVLAQPFARL